MSYLGLPIASDRATCYPDRAKKSCIGWDAEIQRFEQETGKPRVWRSDRIECRLCHKFFSSEQFWTNHYVSQHSDGELMQQSLRRSSKWSTINTSMNEVEAAIELAFAIDEIIGMCKKVIKDNVLRQLSRQELLVLAISMHIKIGISMRIGSRGQGSHK